MPASLSPGIWYNILRGIGKLAVIINVSVLGQMGPLAQPPGSRPPPTAPVPRRRAGLCLPPGAAEGGRSVSSSEVSLGRVECRGELWVGITNCSRPFLYHLEPNAPPCPP